MRLSLAKKSALVASSLLGVASASLTAEDTAATLATDNLSQIGTTYTATFLQKSSTEVRGTMIVTPGTGGVGVSMTLMLTGLPGPDEDGYVYHINTLPVPSNGNCAATGGVLDPFNAGAASDCGITNPSACQVGDLSSKHGPMLPYNYLSIYSDNYLSLDTEDPAFIGNRSIVISASDGTPVNCANFTLLGEVITRPLPLNPPSVDKPVKTFSEPSLPGQLAPTLATGTTDKIETRSSSSLASNTQLVSDVTTTHSVMTANHTAMVKSVTSTILATGRLLPCATQQALATGLMTAAVTAPSGVARPTGSSQFALCTPATAPVAYHSPTVSSPASDARSIQFGRSGFIAVASIVGAVVAAFI